MFRKGGHCEVRRLPTGVKGEGQALLQLHAPNVFAARRVCNGLTAQPRMHLRLHAVPLKLETASVIDDEASHSGTPATLPPQPISSSRPSWRAMLQLAAQCCRLFAFSALLLLMSLLPRPKPAHAGSRLPSTLTPQATVVHQSSRSFPLAAISSQFKKEPAAAKSSVPTSAAPASVAAAPLSAAQPSLSSGDQQARPSTSHSPAAHSDQTSHTSTRASTSASVPPAHNTTSASSTHPSALGHMSNTESLTASPASTSQLGDCAAPVPPAAAGPYSPMDVALAQQLGILPAEAAMVGLFERCRGSIVNVVHTRSMQSFSTLDVSHLPHGQGSGVVWDHRGHVVTNYHLVKGAAEVKVTLPDHSTYTAKLVGHDAVKDIAVLKLSMPKTKLPSLQPPVLGRAVNLRVGQAAYAIGNPWALDHALAAGVISGLNRELSGGGLFPIKNTIQVDCAINQGFSGGGLFDSQGRLVGITTTAGEVSGTGCAVPICTIKGLVDQILLHGRPMRPALGATLAPAQVLQQMGIEGVLLLEVPHGSPAHAAGLRPTHRDIFGDIILGDIVVALDSKPVANYAALYAVLDGRRVGDRVKVDLLRDGKSTSATVTLGERVMGQTEE